MPQALPEPYPSGSSSEAVGRARRRDTPRRFVMPDQSDHDTPLPKPYPSGPGWPSASAALNRDRDEYTHEKCSVNRYRNGHIYDILINSALDASLAQKIFSAVGGLSLIHI